jgi:hypothetical protein
MGWSPDQYLRKPSSPVALFLVVLIRDRPFDYENEVLDLAFRRLMKWLQEVISVGQGEKGIVQVHFGNPGHGTHDNVFDARLGRSGHGNRIAVAAQSGGDPDNFDFREESTATSRKIDSFP